MYVNNKSDKSLLLTFELFLLPVWNVELWQSFELWTYEYQAEPSIESHYWTHTYSSQPSLHNSCRNFSVVNEKMQGWSICLITLLLIVTNVHGKDIFSRPNTLVRTYRTKQPSYYARRKLVFHRTSSTALHPFCPFSPVNIALSHLSVDFILSGQAPTRTAELRDSLSRPKCYPQIGGRTWYLLEGFSPLTEYLWDFFEST